MDAAAVNVAAYAANLAPLPVTLTATITNPPNTPLSYRLSNSGSAVAGSSFVWQSSQAGSLTISFPGPAALGAGSFQGSVDLAVCLDAACAQPITASPAHIMVTYVVEPGSQPAASFTVGPGPAQITSPLFTSQTTSILDDFSFYVTDFPSSGLWVQIRQPAGGPITSAALEDVTGPTAVVGLTLKSPATLGPGIYNDSVSFSLCYDSTCQSLVAGSPVTEPIDFTVSASVGIEYTSQTATVPGASSVAWDPANQQLYATTVSGGADPDALLQIDPLSGAVGPSLTLPVALTQLAISGDGQYAYVSSKDQPTIYRVQLPSLVSDLQIPLGSGANGANSVYQMAVAPGANQTLAVSLDSGGSTAYTAGIAVFDGATQRPNLLPPLNSLGEPAPLAWSDSAATLYALRSAPANPAWLSEIDLVNVTTSGLAVGTAFPIDLQTDPLHAIFYAGGRLYGNDATVRDATSGATLGQFAIPDGYQIITLLPDPANSRVFFLTHAMASSHLVLLYYSSVSFAMVSLADLGYDNSGGYPLSMTLWGGNGIAFDYGGDSVVILGGAFTPAAQGAHASPAIQRLAMPYPVAAHSAR
ncbi:MAG: hypothetical protein KGJ68_13320 [Gammaproteobacteria bacterium]|nr:hypothetical protein [Gammaproteobacteria bacterium]